MDGATKFNLAYVLMQICHKEYVDVIDLFSSPPVLKKEVVLNGKRIFCENEMKAEACPSGDHV